jgi:hypothetical protein
MLFSHRLRMGGTRGDRCASRDRHRALVAVRQAGTRPRGELGEAQERSRRQHGQRGADRSSALRDAYIARLRWPSILVGGCRRCGRRWISASDCRCPMTPSSGAWQRSWRLWLDRPCASTHICLAWRGLPRVRHGQAVRIGASVADLSVRFRTSHQVASTLKQFRCVIPRKTGAP